MTNTEMLAHVKSVRNGYLTKVQIEALANDSAYRLMPLLVRCGGCRFIAPAQDAGRIIAMIERSEMDYIRDVSIASGPFGEPGEVYA